MLFFFFREKGRALWNKVGEQYLLENESDYKDLMDFPRPDPENYPATGIISLMFIFFLIMIINIFYTN